MANRHEWTPTGQDEGNIVGSRLGNQIQARLGLNGFSMSAQRDIALLELLAGTPEVASVKGYGVKGDGVTDETAAIEAVLDALSSAGGGIAYFPPGTYAGNATSGSSFTLPANVHVEAHAGAVFLNIQFSTGSGGGPDRATVRGGRFKNTLGSGVLDNPINIWGENVHMEDVEAYEDGGLGAVNWGTGVFFRRDALRCSLRRFRTFLGDSDSVVLQGKQLIVGDGHIHGNDDGVVVKGGSHNPGASHLLIHNIISENNADVFATGSEILTPCFNIQARGLIGVNVARGAYVKVGKLAAASGGTLRNLLVDGLQMYDVDGSRFAALVEVSVRLDSFLRGAIFRNLQAYVRGKEASAKGIFINADDIDGTGASEIEDVLVDGVQITDVYDGAANGAAAPGQPIGQLVYIEEGTNNPTARGLVVRNFKGRGCASHGARINCPSGNEVLLDAFELRYWGNAAGSPAAYALKVTAGTVVRAKGLKFNDPGVVSGGPFSIDAGGTLIAEEMVTLFGDLAAGSGEVRALWVAPTRCYVYEAFLINRSAITQSDVDYTTFSLQKEGVGTIKSATTKTTGGLAIGARTPVNMQSGSYFSGAAGSRALLERGDVLSLQKSDTGAGRAVDDLQVVIRYCPY